MIQNLCHETQNLHVGRFYLTIVKIKYIIGCSEPELHGDTEGHKSPDDLLKTHSKQASDTRAHQVLGGATSIWINMFYTSQAKDEVGRGHLWLSIPRAHIHLKPGLHVFHHV